MSHKHNGRMQHRLCTLVGGASLLYVTIQRSTPHIAAAAACFLMQRKVIRTEYALTRGLRHSTSSTIYSANLHKTLYVKVNQVKLANGRPFCALTNTSLYYFMCYGPTNVRNYAVAVVVYSKQHRVLGLCLSGVPAMLDIHDNLRSVVSNLRRLVSLHTEVVRVQLQSCMSHQHGGRMRHCVCSGCPAGASLLYVTIQRSPLYAAVVAVVGCCFAQCGTSTMMIFQRVTVGQLLQCLDNARGKITPPVAVVRCLYRDEFELYGIVVKVYDSLALLQVIDVLNEHGTNTVMTFQRVNWDNYFNAQRLREVR
eukprot:9554-Heterococcus_DN1.PRE.7